MPGNLEKESSDDDYSRKDPRGAAALRCVAVRQETRKRWWVVRPTHGMLRRECD